MDLAALQRHWDTFGKQDPFWAILTDPERRGNRWSPEEFFETGRVEIAELMANAERLAVPRRWQRALDFGCGAGRLTQALGDRFASVVGVDVAPSMIALARAHNRQPHRCVYEINDRPDLARWPDASFDLVYTSRVLQHIEPRYARAYLREFLRLLAPGGYLSFDLPSASGDAAALAAGTVPASAMRARIGVTPAGPLQARGGDALPFTIAVTNASEASWRDADGHELNVGNHWLDARGELVRQDDVRVKLPVPLAPGEGARVRLVVRAPLEPGRYRLQFDVVQEGVAWFAACGSEAAEIAVHVSDDAGERTPASALPSAAAATVSPAADADPAARGADLEPVMEMHAVPRDEVETIVHEAGGRVLEVRRVHHCGPLWLAYRYDVTRAGQGSEVLGF
jgi:SAM-dependent methyltransferase